MSSSKKQRSNEQEQSAEREARELFDKPVKQSNTEGESFWSLGSKKRLTISTFKNITYVNIREYYEQDGTMLPTKKGISLTLQQWRTIKDVIPDIDKQLGRVEGSAGTKKTKRG